ncbi:alpha/beta hydrolase [Enterobacteriaceae bacterium BIT-l23]|uniref:Alpha/beta hydrolase n=1 Tax=Jejubacter calystegiae TaxID=2579935 RepID=A0A4P8YI52_9ENTR|nr:alpha/beta hydrolase [Jejubacter calystegiae]NUU64913.1 alpha/beta hydrolase [Enterobacteriaceae bacterium BIT-l23]QCT20415.1 alpha/beta hydrolase [Jejubacter calystegiae]
MNAFFSSTANCDVRWQDLPGSGAPLIFIHGLGCASSYEYPRVVTDPMFRGRRAILVDLPGCGYSQKPKNYSYSISDQARVVAELVEYLGLAQCFLYGHSMGGSISIEAAEYLGERLSGLVVSEPNFHPGGGFFSQQICSHSEDEFVNGIWQSMITRDTGPWAGSLAVDAPWAVWRGAASLIAGSNWYERFVALPVAKQLLVGEHSLPDEDFATLTASGISTLILADCGHCMSWENPEALAHALANFCR